MNLVIVESPTKAKTIKQFLGKGYMVESSFGHVRDLPKTQLGVDVEHDFTPKYLVLPRARKRIQELQKKSKKADTVILATDEDREGEAIAWHLLRALKIAESKTKRIVFHEITKQAIENALKNPRQIDMNLVDAQQARRILDRLVGYKLSPFLWKKVARGLSAGRVQSVAVRLIVEREREIENFKPEVYYIIEATLKSQMEFLAKLIKIDNLAVPKPGIKTKEEADKILKDLDGAEYSVIDIQKKEINKHPLPPFTTSTLQQEATYKLGFSAKKTMLFAQQLYETGLITYHRTDSLNLSEEFLRKARDLIIDKFGKDYALTTPRYYKTKAKGAQEAHEAIRATYPEKEPGGLKESLDKNQYRLYNLIWQRAIACQMQSAILDSTTIDIKSKNYLFRTTGAIMKFDGFLRVYPAKVSEIELPNLEKNAVLQLIKLESAEHFTKPPAHYNEASLIKTLEEYGIGRPSTYAPILSTIQERNYVIKQKHLLYPTEMGVLVNDILVKHFPEIVDTQFTAQMEEEFDKIAQGNEKWAPVIKNFYGPFDENLQKKYLEINKEDLTEKTDKICEKCGKPMLVKISRFGKFLGCSGFPECKHTESLKRT